MSKDIVQLASQKKRQVHFTFSPVHFPRRLLEAYVAIPKVFLSLYDVFRKDVQANKLPYDAKWDTLFTLLAKLVSVQPRLLKALPLDQQMRFQTSSSSEQKQYEDDVFSFATLLAQDTQVRTSGGQIVSLWASFPQNKPSSYGLTEGYILSMWCTLQWEYQAFFDTSPFYGYFQKRYVLVAHPEFLNVLQYYALEWV